MDILTMWLIVLAGLLTLLVYILLIALLSITKRLVATNKQLLIIIAGKEGKSEALRALVASEKPPQGKLRGIATGKKGEEKPKNTNYEMTIGVG